MTQLQKMVSDTTQAMVQKKAVKVLPKIRTIITPFSVSKSEPTSPSFNIMKSRNKSVQLSKPVKKELVLPLLHISSTPVKSSKVLKRQNKENMMMPKKSRNGFKMNEDLRSIFKRKPSISSRLDTIDSAESSDHALDMS